VAKTNFLKLTIKIRCILPPTRPLPIPVKSKNEMSRAPPLDKFLSVPLPPTLAQRFSPLHIEFLSLFLKKII